MFGPTTVAWFWRKLELARDSPRCRVSRDVIVVLGSFGAVVCMECHEEGLPAGH